MSHHAFVDESTRGQYLLCAAVVGIGDLEPVRRTLRGLRQSGRRVHMAHENERRRRLILSTLAGTSLRAHIYVARITGSQRAARDDCLRLLIPEMLAAGVTRLVMESCDQDKHDRQTIYDALAKADSVEGFAYVHTPPSGDPILWAADAVAWAWGRGGDWRRRIAPNVAAVRQCGL